MRRVEPGSKAAQRFPDSRSELWHYVAGRAWAGKFPPELLDLSPQPGGSVFFHRAGVRSREPGRDGHREQVQGGQSPQQGTDKVKEAGGGDQGIRD